MSSTRCFVPLIGIGSPCTALVISALLSCSLVKCALLLSHPLSHPRPDVTDATTGKGRARQAKHLLCGLPLYFSTARTRSLPRSLPHLHSSSILTAFSLLAGWCVACHSLLPQQFLPPPPRRSIHSFVRSCRRPRFFPFLSKSEHAGEDHVSERRVERGVVSGGGGKVEVEAPCRAPAADGRGGCSSPGERRRRVGAQVRPGRDEDNGGRACHRHLLHPALLRLLLEVAEAQRHPSVPDREPVAAFELGPAADGPGLDPGGHGQLLQVEQAGRGRVRPGVPRRAPGRRRRRRLGGRREAAVGAVAAGRRRVPQRGRAHRQAAAPQPRQAAGMVRRPRREAARLRVPAQQEPRRIHLRPEQERSTGVERAAQHRPRHRARHAVPPRGLPAQGGPPGPQGQQRAPRPQDEPQDLRLWHGKDLRGRLRRDQHGTRRRNVRVHGARVRLGGRLLGEVGRVQLRRARAGDLERAEERRAVSGGAPAVPHPRCMEALDRRPRRRVHGPVAGAVLLQGGGVAVLPRGPAVRAGRPRRAADHVHRPAHAHQRPHEAPRPGHAAALHQAQEQAAAAHAVYAAAAAHHQDGVHRVAAVHQRRLHHRHRATMRCFLRAIS